MTKKDGLYDKLGKCTREEEVKHEFAKFFHYTLDTRDNIDLYTEEILFEFKYDIKMDNIMERAKAIAQALYYIRRLKYGRDMRIPSGRICVVDKDEALFIETDKLKDYFLISKSSDYDWDLRPSNPCKKLVKALSKDKEVKDTYIYHFNNIESEREFIAQLDLYRNGEQISFFGNKKEINENNFYEVFQYWESLFGEYVENGRKSSEYFITDIEQGRTNIIDGSQILFRMNSGDNVTKYLPISKYEHFWNVYDRINNPSIVSGIRQKMDRMSEIELRRFTGEFFTPINFADKGLDYIGRILGKQWWASGKYRLWDMAAGTGNLEYLLPAGALKYCYISTLLPDDVEYCKKIYPEATVFEYDYLNDDVNILCHPALLKMGVRYQLPDNLVNDLVNPEIKWILLFNPPYVTSNNMEKDKSKINKDNVSMTKIQKIMTDNNLGEVSRELLSQFLYRISLEFAAKQAYIAMFSKIKYIISNNDQKLRDNFFNYKYEKGFMFGSDNFDRCSGKFPVSFMIWNMNKHQELSKQKIIVDIYDKQVEKIGIKELKVETRKAFLSKWIEREACTIVMPPFSNAITMADKNKDKRDRVADGFLASFMCKGNEFANQNYTAFLSAPYVSAGALSVTPKNFEKSMIVHTVRRLPKATWINDRDQLMQPQGECLNDREFVTDCVIWSLFATSNSTASLNDVEYEGKSYRIKNEFFPFLISELEKWEVHNPDIRTQIYAKHNDRFVAEWLDKHNKEISKEGKDVLLEATEVYQYFYINMMEVSWPKYKIYNWDVGWWQIRMSLNDAGIGQDELEKLNNAHINLGQKLIKKIYQYRFIEPDMQTINI